MNRNLSVGDLLSNYKNSMKIATHDNPIFKSVPATGPRGDQPAGQQWKDLLKDESLLRTIDRLKAEDGDQKEYLMAGDLPDWATERYEPEDINPKGGNIGEGPTHQEEEQLTIPGLPLDLVNSLLINPEIANRIIKGPRTPNTIRGIPHLDSNFIDQKIKNNWQMLEPPRPSGGPQLPDFVQGQGSEGFEVADAKALTKYLDSLGRSQRTGSFRDSPIKGQDLIDALKIGKQLLEQA